MNWVKMLLFNNKNLSSKQIIETSMISNYGENWFEEITKGLKNSKVRKSVVNKLDLKPKNEI